MGGDFHTRREDVFRRLKGDFAHVPASRALSDELIRERREEAKAEDAGAGASGGPERSHTPSEVERMIEDAEAQIDRGEGLSFREAFGEDL